MGDIEIGEFFLLSLEGFHDRSWISRFDTVGVKPLNDDFFRTIAALLKVVKAE